MRCVAYDVKDLLHSHVPKGRLKKVLLALSEACLGHEAFLEKAAKTSGMTAYDVVEALKESASDAVAAFDEDVSSRYPGCCVVIGGDVPKVFAESLARSSSIDTAGTYVASDCERCNGSMPIYLEDLMGYMRDVVCGSGEIVYHSNDPLALAEAGSVGFKIETSDEAMSDIIALLGMKEGGVKS